MIKVLSIAGSDPSSGAGIQVDLKTFQSLGAFGMAIPAALTVQNSKGVSAVDPLSGRFLSRELETLLSDIRPDGIKTGMLLSKANVDAVARVVGKLSRRSLVIDPVLTSSSGKTLLQKEAISALKRNLFPLARVVTPNIPEAEILASLEIRTDQDMDYAAGRLLDLGPDYVLIKGGHRKGPAVDALYGGKSVLFFSTARSKGEFHGTGCVYSAAITVFIAEGFPVEKAVEKAKLFVDKMLRTAESVGRGRTKYFQFP
jgi:hydroxymethylpyrimidine/phosphomethylpyrimidine kinase